MMFLSKITGFFKKELCIKSWILILVGIAIVSIVISINSCKKQKVLSIEEPKLTPVTKDKEGNSIIPIQNVEAIKSPKGIVVKEITKYITKIDTIFRDIPIYIDSTGDTIKIENRDNYLIAEVVINTKTRVGSIGIISIDTLTYKSVIKHRFLRPDIYNIQINNTSPYNKITYGSNISVLEKKRRWGLGIQMGIIPSLRANKVAISPYLGLGVSYNLLTW